MLLDPLVSLNLWKQKPKSKYYDLAIDVIRELRGELSQRELSDKMGYSFNQVGKWEAGSVQFKFGDFLKMVSTLNYPVESQMRHFFYVLNGPFTEENICEAVKSVLVLTDPNGSFFKGHRPDFAEFLEALDQCPNHMVAWLMDYVDCSQIQLLKSLYENYISRVAIVKKFPMTTLIYAALQLQCYLDSPHHDEKLLAHHSACTSEQVREVLSQLLRSGWVIFVAQKFKITTPHFGFSTIANNDLRGMTKFATDLAATRYSLTRAHIPEGGNVGQSSFRAIPLSYEGSLRARELLLKFHRYIDEIAMADSGPKNNVQIFVAHRFPTIANSDS